MTGQAAAEARLHPAERQVDLVVHGHHPVERDPELTARGPGGPAGVVHVGLGQQHAHARAADARAAVRVEAAVLRLGLRQPPALGGLGGHLEADVVAGAGVAVARVAQPHYEPVDLAAAIA